MTDTGWKFPQNVNQDSRRDLNGGKSCYPFVNINNIKKDDTSYADLQPWAKTGIDLTHKSPMIYAYNYGFKLPVNAIVNKITLFVLIQQLTHTKAAYDPYGKLRHSVSEFCNVKLKQGSSLVDGGTGTQFAKKCKITNLPYKQWSTEDTTTFSGTPKEWGITADDVVSIINSANFGCVLQLVGTVKNGWCTPAVAKMVMKIEYELPKPKIEECTFGDVTIGYTNAQGVSGKFTFDSNNKSNEKLSLTLNDLTNPCTVTLTHVHKGGAGETPFCTITTNSLKLSESKKGDTVKNTYNLSKIQCETDEKSKEYVQSFFVFSGILVGEQSVILKVGDVEYTLLFNVLSDEMSEKDKARFMDFNNVCRISNCLFYRNHARRNGGACYITSEFYYEDENIYGEQVSASIDNRNVADNIDNLKKYCNNTYWLANCYPQD